MRNKSMTSSNFLERVILYGTRHGWFNWVPDKIYLKVVYRIRMKKSLDFRNPQTFNEKMQWLKVNNRRDIYTTLVDKYSVRAYIKNMIGEKYLIPLLGEVWNRVEDIDFDSLPNQFVLKTTHDSGGVVICTDKSKFDRDKAIKKLKLSLGHDYYGESREWPYKNVKKRIIAETFMKDTENEELKDFKFYCFNGVPTYCHVIGSRQTNETMDFYDMEWNLMPFTKMKNMFEEFPHDTSNTTPPDKLKEMMSIAKKLSKGFPFVRIDLYQINNKVYFGEITFFPNSGFGKFSPESWDSKIGEQINLSQEDK